MGLFSRIFSVNEPRAGECRIFGGIQMIWAQPGTFIMGSPDTEKDRRDLESPTHPVSIEQGFWIGKYAVTKAQWRSVLGTEPWKGRRDVLDDPNSPAVYIDWYDCQTFVHALSQKNIGTFRLPSEAEWEYACRAGTRTSFSYGEDPDYSKLAQYAWYGLLKSEQRYAHCVGQKRPNPWGLYDMHGNVFELCQDGWHSDYNGAPKDGSAWASSDEEIVARGGSVLTEPGICRSACRGIDGRNGGCESVGLRIVRNL